ncbi:MAG: hypothetical protein WCG87_05510 [Bacteroidota bacterium]
MQILLIILAVAMLYVLYKLLRQDKVYTYTRTTIISYQPDGTEYITTNDESGEIIVTSDVVLIDGTGYKYKTIDSRKTEAIMHYAKGHLRSVSILLPIGEKSYFIPDTKPARRIRRRTIKM